MRSAIVWTFLALALATGAGCVPPSTSSTDNALFALVARITESSADPPTESITVDGSVGSDNDYRLIELGPATAGQEWAVSANNILLSNNWFLVVLLNSKYEVLQRQLVSRGTPLRHIVRADTDELYLGVASGVGGDAGDFHLEVSRRAGVPVPAPRQQVVWLNFAGGSDVTVRVTSKISYPAFDAEILGSAYAGATEAVKQAILATMRANYAHYDVIILTSDDAPAPDGPHATVHFVSEHTSLLGLADSVDQYNTDPSQNAIVYVGSFAVFEAMELTDEEMGQMVGNVTSHELGHLLGLFHNQGPKDVMGTTGAWDLASDQSFSVATLEPTVFPFGNENSPQRLSETVGTKAVTKDTHMAEHVDTQRLRRKAALRAFVLDQLRGRCGTCLNPDE